MNRSINERLAAEYYHQTTSANSRYSLFIDSSTLFISYSRLETISLSCCVSFFKKKNNIPRVDSRLRKTRIGH